MTTERSETIMSNLGGTEHNILNIDTNEIIQMPPSLYFEVDALKKLINTTHANKQLYFTFLGSNNPKFTRKYVQLGDVINNINNDICASEMNGKIDKSLTADPNISYNMIHDVLEKTKKNTHMTSKLVKYNKYKNKNKNG